MAPLTKLILIVQAECSEESNLNVLPHDSDRFGSSNNRDIIKVDVMERVHELWEDQVLKQSSILCDFYLEGFPSHRDTLKSNDDSFTSRAQNSSMHASHQQNIMALYHQTFYPCSIPQNLLSLNLTEGNLGPQDEVEQEIRASFTNCHILVDAEAIFVGETVEFRPNDGLSSFLYLPLFPSQDSFSFPSRVDATSLVLVKEVPLLLDTSHAKRLFTQLYGEYMMEPLDPISSINTTSESGTFFPPNQTKEAEEAVNPIITSVAVSSFPEYDATVLKLQQKVHPTMAATIALWTSSMLENRSRMDLLPRTKDLVDTSQKFSILRFQQDERRHMIEQMLKQEMHQIHLILLALCLATLGILLFLGYKLQIQSTEMRKHAMLVEHGIGSTSLQHSSSPIAPDSRSGMLKSKSQQVSPLSIDPNLFQMEPPLSPSAHSATEFRSASPCTKFWTSCRERRGQSYLIHSDTGRRRRAPIYPTNDSALMTTPEPTHPPVIQTHLRVVSPEPCRNESVSSNLDTFAMVARTPVTSGDHEIKNRTTFHPRKPCSPRDLVVQYSNSFLEEYW
jgi:hypothetical protein